MRAGSDTGARRPFGRAGVYLALALVAIVVAVAAVVVLLRRIPPVRVNDVRERVLVTLRREAPASFLVTGYLDATASATVRSRELVLPGILDLNIGTATATVRVPGRISYGFDVRQLRESMIRVLGDTVAVAIPPLAVYSVEPFLSDVEIETSRGWLRSEQATQDLTREALGHLRSALHAQGDAYLHDAVQPRLNTARALEKLLTPVLESAGLHQPHYRFAVQGGLVLEPER